MTKPPYLKLWLPLLTTAVFVCLLGCGHPHRLAELEHIDSLLAVNQSAEALARLKPISPDTLAEDDRMYYALLRSMADYKEYVDIKSDSAISGAVEFYRRKGDNGMLTRALIAKGCTEEVMGNLDEAVACYHEAEDVKNAADTSSVAYAKLRLGVLYQSQVVGTNSIALQKFKEALPLFKKFNDKHYQLICLISIGGIYRNIEEQHDSAVIYMKEALKLALEQNDPYHVFASQYILSEYYLVREKDYEAAKEYGLQAVSADKSIIDHPKAHYRLAVSYLYLGKPDSAIYYMNQAPAATCAMDSIVYYEVKAEIAHMCQKNEGKSKQYLERAHEIADSLTITGLNHRLLAVEKKYDLSQEELKNESLRSRLRGSWLALTLALLAALALVHFLWRYRTRLREKETEHELLKSDLDASLSSLAKMQATVATREQELKKARDGYRQQLDRQQERVASLTDEINDVKSSLQEQRRERRQLTEQIADLEVKSAQFNEIRNIIGNQIQVVRQLIQASYELPGKAFNKKFHALLTVPENEQSESYWANLQSLTNDLYDNVLVKAQEKAGGTLNEHQINFIALLCCGYTRTAIMVCMKYSHVGSVSNTKAKIAKQMDVPSLDDWVRPFREQAPRG